MSVVTLLVLVVLIAVNAFYVAAEFAAVGVRRSRIRQKAEDGHALARRLLPILDDSERLDRYIAACQIGITISSLVLGAYGQVTLAAALEPHLARFGGLQTAAAESTAAVIVLIGLTAFQMILGELVPKSVALQYPSQTALYTVLPMQWSLRVLGWFISVLNGSGLAILRLFGAQGAGHRHVHSPQEIEMLIAESREGGLLKPDEHRRLRRALHLGRRPVREIMVPRTGIKAVNSGATVAEVLVQLKASPYTRLPVFRESLDDIVGLIHAKDVALRVAAGRGSDSLDSLLRPILVVPLTLTGEQLLAQMREQRRLMAVVLDEFGGTAGLVTLDDALEEILGDLDDEFKRHGPPPERLPDGRVRLPGQMRLDEAEPWIGRLWDTEAHTVGGAVMEAIGRVPVAGERLEIDEVAVEVEHVVGRRIDSVIARPREVAPEGDGRHG